MCEADDNARWRTARLSLEGLLTREVARGKKVSPIFSVMGVTNRLFKIDWLHACDKGVAADFLGNFFEFIVQHKLPGRTIADRCNALCDLAGDFYDRGGVEDRLKSWQRSAWSSEKKKTRPPSLKGNAASTRALVPFADELAQRYLSHDVPVEGAMKAAAFHLRNCYAALSGVNKLFGHDAMQESAKSFAQQYKSLWEAHGKGVRWRPMPKMHMFLELCSQRTEPSKFWCYRDEDFGGSVARQSRMRGRWRHLGAFGKRALDMFRMKNPAPRIVRKTFCKNS